MNDDDVRHSLVRSESHLSAGENDKALECCMVPFQKALSRKIEDNSFFDFSDRIRSIQFFSFATDGAGRTSDANRAIGELGSLFNEAITVIGYGLKLNDYKTLRTYAPIIHNVWQPEPIIQWTNDATEDKHIVRRCIEFVTDFALKVDETREFARQTPSRFPTTA